MRITTILAGAVLALASVSCGSGEPAGEPGPSPTSAPFPPASSPVVPPSPNGGGGQPSSVPGGGGTWTSGPTVVDHDVSVPPVPRVTGVRSAQHPEDGYDRVVLDIAGPLPGYRVEYVDRPVADGSGEPVSVPGRRFLQIRLEPAQAHTDEGVATTPRAATVGYPMLEAWAITGDFEGVVTVVLGLDDVVGYRVGELPGRIYLDVAA